MSQLLAVFAGPDCFHPSCAFEEFAVRPMISISMQSIEISRNRAMHAKKSFTVLFLACDIATAFGKDIRVFARWTLRDEFSRANFALCLFD